MVKNYLKIALRNILKSKTFSFINISGLSIGIGAFLLILIYVQSEWSYDKFHRNSSSIYRVALAQYLNNELIIASAENYPGVGPALTAEFPEVKGYARLYNMGYKNNLVITYEEAINGPIQFKHRKFLYADSSFLPMFGYEMKYGQAERALQEPFSAVISGEYAKKYFGDEDPIGKMLRLEDDDGNNELAKVTGVFKDLPVNTHLKFDVLFSYKTLYARGDWAPTRYDQTWERKDMYTYVELEKGADPTVLESKFPSIVEKYSPGLAERNRRDVLSLQPLESIHLHSKLAEEAEPNGTASTVYTLTLVAVFILIIAWVNYVNLSTAKAMERAGEVGVRKVMGAFKHQLVRQFLAESAIINLASVLLAILIMALVLPLFNNLSGLALAFLDLFTGEFLGMLVLLWMVGTVLSGLYPAFVLSSFKPAIVLKGKFSKSSKSVFLRKVLVVFQFTTSVALIASTLIVYDQLNYMMDQNIGMNIDRVMVVERPGVAPNDRQAFQSSIDVFRNELLKNGDVSAVSTSLTVPGKKREYKSSVKKYGDTDDNIVTLRLNSMDDQFTSVFEMQVLAGRTFSKDYPNDTDTSVVITASAAKLLGFENVEEAVGQTIAITDFQWNPIIVGVVNDYHQEALQKGLDPIMFFCTYYGGEFYSMRISGDRLNETIAHVNDSWDKAFPGNPFEYFFLNDYFNRQYAYEQKFGSLFTFFAVVAILLGCLGLFGLSAYTAQQKTKEIGIRKVLGSSVNAIFILLSKDFVKLIGIATLVAVPLIYYFMGLWLGTFAHRIDIPVLVFVLAGGAVMIVALITISFQALKAARVNPVDSLRYE